MTAHAASTACAPQPSKATGIPGVRTAHKQVEYDSEAETLVGSESDDDDDAHPASANNQPAAGHGAAGWPSAHEPCAPTQNNIDAAIRAKKQKEMEDAIKRSLLVIIGARRMQQKAKICQ
ncbi:hypothetical protein G6011_00217 [Alternaria panax]|uniref:Uncharacterized protein n=1 Tax=Alternaria panax TaxID=48097 RepID=A0AAD4NUI3_9PLEO|nr:hypothetical protein G6011_00217 [Alternaria panax]